VSFELRAGEILGMGGLVGAGRTELVRAIFGVDPIEEGSIEVELVDMLTSEERVALLVRERFVGEGEPVEIRRANVYRVRGDKIVEISIFEADQYVVDALMDDVESS